MHAGAAQQHANDTRQYVTFLIDDGLFAVPLAEVQEIIRMPEVVQVPLSHAQPGGIGQPTRHGDVGHQPAADLPLS